MITDIAKNEGLDGILIDTIKLHSADPGPDGLANLIAGTETAIVLDAAVGGVRSMAAPLDISVPAGAVSHYTLFSGTVLKSSDAFAVAETYAAPGTANITTATLTAT